MICGPEKAPCHSTESELKRACRLHGVGEGVTCVGGAWEGGGSSRSAERRKRRNRKRVPNHLGRGVVRRQCSSF